MGKDIDAAHGWHCSYPGSQRQCEMNLRVCVIDDLFLSEIYHYVERVFALRQCVLRQLWVCV